ncbi:MAG: methanogenesis marker protein Mmp4/MtxX [archaeon]|nr:methanogenesis marker protein Mmp4/MtxX [archaeon]
MLTSGNIIDDADYDVKIGIGCGPDSKYVETSVRAMNNPNILIYRDPQKLASDLADGVIDAAVRGDMSSSKLLPLVKKALDVPSLDRAVLLNYRDRVVLLAPVGIDEGWTIEDRINMAKLSEKLMKDLGSDTVRIAVMSGGRSEDIGRNDVVDRSIIDAMEIVKTLNKDGYDSYHAQILLEDALDEADVIIAPNGITGNVIFRSMHFIGGVPALGAPVLNTDKVFIDTSRVKTDYTDSICLAIKLAGMRK